LAADPPFLELHSFPTRRSSDLAAGGQTMLIFLLVVMFVYLLLSAQYESYILPLAVLLSLPIGLAGIYLFASIFNISNSIYLQIRSEEHTSELQSRENLVCRLLL